MIQRKFVINGAQRLNPRRRARLGSEHRPQVTANRDPNLYSASVPCGFLGAELGCRWIVSPDDQLGEAFHLFKLRAELQQQQIHSGLFKLFYALSYMFLRTYKSGA